MRKESFIVLICLLSGCSSPSSKSDISLRDSTVNTRRALHVAKKGNLDDLLYKYSDISIDTLEVFPPKTAESADYKFKGTALDSSDMSLLPFDNKRNLYGCFRFQIDSAHTGLITRCQSEYVASAVNLFVLDNLNKKIIGSYLPLADIYGDEGSGLEIKSFLFKAKSYNIRILTWRQISIMVPNKHDTTFRLTNYVDLIRWNNEKFDTLDNNLDRLMRKIEKLNQN
jgi:hypothetical protein